ncbi:hypothetical protein P0F65_10295 [Sphingomonas sp. I4]
MSAFAAGRGVKGGGRIANANLDVRDVAPTLLDYAGLRQPSRFAGHAILPHEGHSLRPVLAASADGIRSADETLGYELFFRRALRQGIGKPSSCPSRPIATRAAGSAPGVGNYSTLLAIRVKPMISPPSNRSDLPT